MHAVLMTLDKVKTVATIENTIIMVPHGSKVSRWGVWGEGGSPSPAKGKDGVFAHPKRAKKYSYIP